MFAINLRYANTHVIFFYHSTGVNTCESFFERELFLKPYELLIKKGIHQRNISYLTMTGIKCLFKKTINPCSHY